MATIDHYHGGEMRNMQLLQGPAFRCAASQKHGNTNCAVHPLQSRDTITCPSCITVKIVATAEALQSGKKSYPIPHLISLV